MNIAISPAGRWFAWQSVTDARVCACVAVILGLFDASFLIGWHQLSPTNLSWLKGDPAVYQAGWEFLRRQPWSFPLTWVGQLDYPSGVSAAYLDVIPIVAVPLHLLSNVLPNDFQYLGAHAAICLVLQAYFGLRLMSRFTSDWWVILIGGIFFLASPILLNRLSGHFSLCSQWLLIAGFYYYFRPARQTGSIRYMSPFLALAAISGGITPYLTVMVLLISLAALVRLHLEQNKWNHPGRAVQGPS